MYCLADNTNKDRLIHVMMTNVNPLRSICSHARGAVRNIYVSCGKISTGSGSKEVIT